MSSRRPVRQLVVAILFGVLVGGGLMAVTPAGAEVSQAVATNWKKIWKKNLKPLADRRYYTKAQSDTRYQPKGSYETAGSGYTKAESDAKYAGAGSSYSKADSDGKYQAKTQLIRGGYMLGGTGAAAGEFLQDAISFGVNLSAEPTVHFIPLGAAVPAGCSGTPAAPDAVAGHLCVFEAANLNNTVSGIYQVSGGPGSSTMGAVVVGASAGAGTSYSAGSWAVRPLAVTSARIKAPTARKGTFGR